MYCKRIALLALLTQFLFSITPSFAAEIPIEDFSIAAYNQNIDDFLIKNDKNYEQSLLTPEYQRTQLQRFYQHYYASDQQGLSPWSEQMVNALLPSVKTIELELIAAFDNQKQEPTNYHYGENFKEHSEQWLNKIKLNMALDTLDSTHFNPEHQAIAVNNSFARALPENAPDFFHFSLSGQGFPFDNLQESAIWAGTPLYVIHSSKDKAWSLVLTPDAYFAWIKTSDLAYASHDFIRQWQKAAQDGLAAITQTQTSVVDKQHHFLLEAYIGAVFPLAQQTANSSKIFIPLRGRNQQAIMSTGFINHHAAQLMPLPASPKNMAKLIKQLQNRPYGWGGSFFFNDCSQELKSLFTPFALWLPRNSAQQALQTSVDLSTKNVDERLSILKEKGHPLMTIIYIGGHVMLYLGSQENERHEQQIISYQNIWGLAPANKSRRYIIGQSLLFPLLKYYPENPDASSLADKSYFKLIYLDELNPKPISAQKFTKQIQQGMRFKEQ